MHKLGVEMVYSAADYRLLSRRAVEALMQFGEVNMFLRGMVPLLGFKTAEVYYERGERVAGESKYPLKKMVAFAIGASLPFPTSPSALSPCWASCARCWAWPWRCMCWFP